MKPRQRRRFIDIKRFMIHKGSSLLVPSNGLIQKRGPSRAYETLSRGVPQRAQLYFKGFALKANKSSTREPSSGFHSEPRQQGPPRVLLHIIRFFLRPYGVLTTGWFLV